MNLSLLILTQDRPLELEACLKSVVKHLKQNIQVVILDNASQPPVSEQLRKQFSQFEFFRSENPLGVAGGRNLLASKAKGDFLWFLDDDAELSCVDYISILEEYFKKPDLSVVSFKVTSLFSGLEEKNGVPHRKKPDWLGDKTVSYFNGCSFVIRAAAFDAGGRFWNELHYSGEELGLSYRLMEKGWILIYSPKLWVFHRFQKNSVRTRAFIYFNTRNRPWLALRFLPLPYVITHLLLWWGYLGMKSVQQGEISTFFRGVLDSIKYFPEILLNLREPLAIESCLKISRLGGRVWF